jgi:xylulokinase
MAFVIGVDSSTQSVKVEIRNADTGVLAGSGRAAHPATTPPKSEQDPNDWWDALRAALDQALNLLTPSERIEIVAISVGGQQHGMVALDAAGSAVHPGKLWNDTESASQSESLIAGLGAEQWAMRAGSVPVPAFTITKIAWLRETHPDLYARISHVHLPHDEMTRRLCGRFVTDRGDASGTGYWSPTANAYDVSLLAEVDASRDWASVLPEILGPKDAAGTIPLDVAALLGLSSSVVVGPGTGDNMAAALGLGLRPGDVVISLGTSGTVYAVSDKPITDPSGAVAGFADATGRYLPLVCTLNATKVTDAFARLLGLGYQAFDDLALATPAGAGGLVLLPYLDGERTPNRPNATGVLSGIRSDVSRGQLARAAIEGVVCGLLDGLDALSTAGVLGGGRLLLIGGGARSGAYRQIVADLAQRPVLVPEADEFVAVGAALQAAVVWRTASDPAASVSFADVAQQWQLGAGYEVVPGIGPAEAANVRAAYATVRDATE